MSNVLIILVLSFIIVVTFSPMIAVFFKKDIDENKEESGMA